MPTTEAEAPEPVPFALTLPPKPPSRPSLEPLSADQWSMRVTIDGALKDDVETLRCLLSHKIPQGDLAAVLDHAEPVALGGPSTVETIRGRFRIHNLLHAEEVFGREHMARYRRKGGPEPRTGESAIAGGSAQSVKDGIAPPAAGPRRKS